MKITQTEIYKLTIPMEPFVIATEVSYFTQNIFIRLHTDEGITGMGECSAFPIIDSLRSVFLTAAMSGTFAWTLRLLNRVRTTNAIIQVRDERRPLRHVRHAVSVQK